MKKESKTKAISRAKTPAVKRAPKTASKVIAVGEKAAAKSKSASVKAKTAAVKAKTPAAKIKPAQAKAAKSPAGTRGAKPKKPKATKAKTRKAKTEGAEAGYKIGEPVLDPIGDVISGEARTYLGEAVSQGRVAAEGQAEIDAYREETEIAAVDGTLEPGPGKLAASEADGGVEEEESEDEVGATERPPAKLERLQKILSQAGIASRRHAEEMIVAGQVMVNGQVVTQLGSKADAGRDHIRVNGKLLKGAERHRYFVLNKPKGYVTTVSDPEKRPTVMDFFSNMGERLYPVGRLDYLSEGLLLMTNDGELANLLSKAGSGVEKVYLVKVAGQPTEEELDKLRGGIAIERREQGSERVRTAPARIRQVRVGDNPWYEVVLTEGRNRELRKMFAAIGHFAEKIRRVGYGPLVLDVEPGKLRELTVEEVNALRLTAEGKMKPKRLRVDISLPKEAGRNAGKWGGKPWERGSKPPQQGAREQGSEGARDRGNEGPRREPRASRTGGFEGRPSFAKRQDKPFGAKPAFGGRSESKPFNREGRTGFGDRGNQPPRAGAGFDRRGGKSFGANPGFGRQERGPGGGKPGGFGERPRFGGGRPTSGTNPRFEKPRFDKPGFKRPEFGGREGGAGRSGERKEWKPRGPGFGGKPREGTAGRFEGAPRKPFRAQGAFVRGESAGSGRSFEGSDGPKRQFSGERGKSFGGGNSSGRRTGSKARWVPRPGGPGKEAGASQTERPRPAFGARPGGFKRPGKPAGFGKSGEFKPRGGAGKSFGGGGKKFGGSKPGAARGGLKRGS